MDKVLSVIVPVYNLKEKVTELIDSFKIEKYGFSDIEIFLINDGSKDDTIDYVIECQRKYPNIIRVVNKENGGHGSVINHGIEVATGKYFKVIDGDDLVDPSELNNLITLLKTIDVDLILTPYKKLFIEDNSIQICEVSNKQLKPYEIYSFDEIANKISPLGIHSATFLTSILKDNNIRVDEKVFYDDTQYSIYPIQYVNSVIFTPNPIYIYRLGFAEQSMNIVNRMKRKDQLELVVLNIVEYYLKLNFNNSKRDYIKMFTADCIKCVYDVYFEADTKNKYKEDLIAFDRKIKLKSPELYFMAMSKKIYLFRKSRYVLYHFIVYMNKQKARLKNRN